MSEAKKIAIGVLGGISGIAALFALVLMLAGKGDEPAARPEPLLARVEAKPPVSAPAPALPAEAAEQPQPLLAEQPPAPAASAQPEATPAVLAGTVGDSSAAGKQTAPPQPLAQAEPKTSSATASSLDDTGTRTESKAASAPAVAERSPTVPPTSGPGVSTATKQSDAAPIGGTSNGTTATGIPTYVGPRGGVYHYSKSGKKVYERRR